MGFDEKKRVKCESELINLCSLNNNKNDDINNNTNNNNTNE